MAAGGGARQLQWIKKRRRTTLDKATTIRHSGLVVITNMLTQLKEMAKRDHQSKLTHVLKLTLSATTRTQPPAICSNRHTHRMALEALSCRVQTKRHSDTASNKCPWGCSNWKLQLRWNSATLAKSCLEVLNRLKPPNQTIICMTLSKVSTSLASNANRRNLTTARCSKHLTKVSSIKTATMVVMEQSSHQVEVGQITLEGSRATLTLWHLLTDSKVCHHRLAKVHRTMASTINWWIVSKPNSLISAPYKVTQCVLNVSNMLPLSKTQAKCQSCPNRMNISTWHRTVAIQKLSLCQRHKDYWQTIIKDQTHSICQITTIRIYRLL